MMDLASLKNLLRGLPRANVSVPDGFMAILRRDVVAAGGDPQAVETWISQSGGRVVPAPDPILSSGPAQWREPGRDARAYIFPSHLLD